MFKLPLHFDENEWFILISMFFLIIGFFIIPKIIPKGMTLSLLLYYAIFGLNADILIGVDYPFNFYTIMDSPKLELFDVFAYLVNYPIFGYFFSYIIYKWRMPKTHLILFILLWSGLATFIEWISERFNIYTYLHGWNTGYSGLLYLLIFSSSAFVVKIFSRYWGAYDPA